MQAPTFTFVKPSEVLQVLKPKTGHCVMGGNTPKGPNKQDVKAAVDAKFKQIEMFVAIGGGTLLVIALMAGLFGVYSLLKDSKEAAKIKKSERNLTVKNQLKRGSTDGKVTDSDIHETARRIARGNTVQNALAKTSR